MDMYWLPDPFDEKPCGLLFRGEQRRPPSQGRGCWAVFVALGGEGMVLLKATLSAEAALSLDGPGPSVSPQPLSSTPSLLQEKVQPWKKSLGGGLGAGTLARRRLEEGVTLPPLRVGGHLQSPHRMYWGLWLVDHLETSPPGSQNVSKHFSVHVKSLWRSTPPVFS